MIFVCIFFERFILGILFCLYLESIAGERTGSKEVERGAQEDPGLKLRLPEAELHYTL